VRFHPKWIGNQPIGDGRTIDCIAPSCIEIDLQTENIGTRPPMSYGQQNQPTTYLLSYGFPISFFFFQKNRKSSRPDPLMIGRHNQRDAGRPRRSRFGGQIALFQLVCRSLSVSLLRIFLIRGQQVQAFLKEHSK
jgi:hypothetical protein